MGQKPTQINFILQLERGGEGRLHEEGAPCLSHPSSPLPSSPAPIPNPGRRDLCHLPPAVIGPSTAISWQPTLAYGSCFLGPNEKIHPRHRACMLVLEKQSGGVLISRASVKTARESTTHSARGRADGYVYTSRDWDLISASKVAHGPLLD